MKKLLLLSLAAVCMTANAAVTDLTKVWTASTTDAFTAENKVWSSPMAIDAEGNVIAAGSFSQEFTIGDDLLEAIGTSAYIVKYNSTGTAAWSVALTGGITVSDICTDAEGNIYVAGSFADMVSFGTTSGKDITKEGMKVNGAFTKKFNAAYIAKYDKNGVALNVMTVVPEIPSALDEAVIDGDISFEIEDIEVAGSKIYAASTYSGNSKIGESTFEAGYVNYFGFMLFPNTKATVFSLDASTLENCTTIVNAGPYNEDGAVVMDLSSMWSAKLAAQGENLVVGMVGSGDIKFNDNVIAAATDAKGGQASHFIYSVFNNGTQTGYAVEEGQSPNLPAENSFAYIGFNGNDALFAGRMLTLKTIKGEDDEETTVTEQSLFVITVPGLNVGNKTVKTTLQADGNIGYNVISSATVIPTGEVYINTLGYYLANDGDHKFGNFSDSAKSFVFANGEFTPATVVTNAIGVAAAGANIAFAQLGDTGYSYSLYNDPKSGIDDIVIGDENAPVEYYNLQGIRVDNPTTGMYIMRQGTKTSKVIIR